MVKTEPAEFVAVVITTVVNCPAIGPGVCSELLLSMEVGVTEAPTLVAVGTEIADLGVDEASGAGITAVNVLENLNVDPAEFVSVTTKTELAVVRKDLGPVVEVVSNVSAEGLADSVLMGVRIFDDSPADVELGTSRVTDVWMEDPKALVVK